MKSAAFLGLGDEYGLDTDRSIVLLRDQKPGGDVAGTKYIVNDNGPPMLVHTVPGPLAVTSRHYVRHSVPDMRPLLAAVTVVLAAPVVTWVAATLFAF